MKPAKVMRREATLTHKARKHTDLENKTTKSALPRMWFDADYCHRNEFGIYVIKDENLQDPCKHRHLSDTRKRYLKIILTGSGNQPPGFWRVFYGC